MRPTIFLHVVVSGIVVVSAFACRPPAAKESPEVPSGSAQAHDDPLPEPAAVALIKPGTKLDPKALPERTHLVFRSKPKVTSGKADKIGKSIREALEHYTTWVLVETEPDPKNPGCFCRCEHRIGVGKPGDAGDLIVSKDAAKELGVSLGLFERKVLGEREKELNTVRSPGASSTMAMFDFSMMFLRDGQRVPIVVRYLSLIDPNEGDVETAYWILDASADGNRFYGDSLWVLPPNHTMDWEMHVDGEQITFGAPSADAFSSTKLPQGTAHTVPAKLKEAAAARSFSAASGARLEQQVRDLLKDQKQ